LAGWTCGLGIPTEDDYIRRYCERTGLATPEALAADWNFYLAYNMFRIAAILQGIAKRVEAGTASSAQAKASGAAPGPWPRWPGVSFAQPALPARLAPFCFFQRRTTWTSTTQPQDQGTAGQRCWPVHGRAHLPQREGQYKAELAANTAPATRWTPLQTIENLKPKAQAAGLWNLFLPVDSRASGYHGRPDQPEYAPLAEIMGRVPWASEVFNCSAPDTGNMETIARYGSEANKDAGSSRCWKARSARAFAMTEPAVASSATPPTSNAHRAPGRRIRHQRPQVVDVRRGRPALRSTSPWARPTPRRRAIRSSMILVPADAKGVKRVRPLNVFGYDDAPHGHMEMSFENVRVPVGNILLGEGRGFEIAQGAWARAASTTACA
jgi:hypothetical protein